MPFLVSVALGCTVFSLLYSIYCFLRYLRREKTEYDRWMEEVQANNIVKSSRPFSRA